jgi:hypothetical protein
LDYGRGTHLAKWQWDELFDPALLVSPFEGDEDAMAMSGVLMENEIEFLDGIETDNHKSTYNLYFTPAGTLYTLPVDAKPGFGTGTNVPVPEGAMVRFTIGDKTYLANYKKNQSGAWEFLGYRLKGSTYSLPPYLSEQEVKQIISKMSESESTSDISTASANYILVLGVAGGEIIYGTGSKIMLEITGATLAKYVPKITNIKNFTVMTIALGFIFDLFTSPAYSPYKETGVVVNTLPIRIVIEESGALVQNPPVAVPIAIPFSVPQQSPDDKCNVYVIYRTRQSEVQVAKYGMTCQTDTDGDPSCKRPAEQCVEFNKANDTWTYYYSIVTPFPVSRRMAFIIERAMTAQYIIAHNGALPEKHMLPCFIKVPDDLPQYEKWGKLEERVQKARKYIEELITQYGK